MTSASLFLISLDLIEKFLNWHRDKMNSHNTFDALDIININEFDSSNFNLNQDALSYKMPSMAIIQMKIEQSVNFIKIRLFFKLF